MVEEIARAADYRANRLLAALDSNDYAQLASSLEVIEPPQGKVLCETGEIIHTD